MSCSFSNYKNIIYLLGYVFFPWMFFFQFYQSRGNKSDV